MVKFVVLFHTPLAVTDFEDRYNDFLALVERMPAIVRRQVNSILGSPVGETRLYRVLEVYFADYIALHAALNSPAGQEAGSELTKFPLGSFEMYFADVYEEDASGGATA